MVSLDGKQTTVITTPNKYTFDIQKKLLPTDYKSVLPAKYTLENLANGNTSAKKFKVSTTAVYTILLDSTNYTTVS